MYGRTGGGGKYERGRDIREKGYKRGRMKEGKNVRGEECKRGRIYEGRGREVAPGQGFHLTPTASARRKVN